MKIWGYGEDALTLWAITTPASALYQATVADATEPQVFYRPSFGRGQGACFGEFDAIVAGARLHLIEAKWRPNGKADIELEDEQRRRHAVFTDYLKCWFELRPSSWKEFDAAVRSKGWRSDKPLAEAGTTLARSLEHVLRTLSAHFRGTMPEVVNQLVVFYQEDKTPPRKQAQWQAAANTANFALLLQPYSDTYFTLHPPTHAG